MIRRSFLLALPGISALSACGGKSAATARGDALGQGNGHGLPLSIRFQGSEKFRELCVRAQAENWAALPLGNCTLKVAAHLRGIPYRNWTLEIDDRIEAPSVNFNGLDCWTAYEIPLAFARMIREKQGPWTERDLLGWIEIERYRNGRCDGTYLSRMHYLEEVFHDNQKRGLATNITPGLPGAVRLQRRITDMSIGWRSYRYLRANPELVRGIDAMERRVSSLPFWHVPRNKVAAIEPLLRAGDILAITSRDASSYTSHVGLAVPMGDGTTRFQHATSDRDKGRQVILDARISKYLHERSSHAGLVVCRPR